MRTRIEPAAPCARELTASSRCAYLSPDDRLDISATTRAHALNARRTLSFFSPCTPDPRGTGWEQRAYSLLRAYAEFMHVDAWFMPTFDNPDLARASALMSTVRTATAFYPCAFDDPGLGLQRRLMTQLASADAVHVSRLPQLAANLPHKTILWDIDELPWSAARPDAGSGPLQRAAPPRLDALYARAAGRCRVVMACSPLERLPGASRFVVMPNVVSGACGQEAAADGPLLFVGNLNYLPNIDALTWFQAEVLPLLLARVPHVQVQIVGRAPASDEARAAIERLQRSPQFRFAFDVPDCAPYYAACAATIAPIRIGGGTRIKIVESFAHRRAVVSTTKGCEGLEVDDDRQLLIADDASSFASRCADLLCDAGLRERLAAAGQGYAERCHAQSVVDALIRRTVDDLLPA